MLRDQPTDEDVLAKLVGVEERRARSTADMKGCHDQVIALLLANIAAKQRGLTEQGECSKLSKPSA